jgi:hypothetical protein
MFDGSICMEESSAFIPKFDPFNGAPLLPVDLLLVKEVLKMLSNNSSKVPLFNSEISEFFQNVKK